MLDKGIIKAAANGRWETIFALLAPELNQAMQCSPRHAKHCPMPGHENAEGKFRFPKDFREAGRAICTCGNWSDGFSLLMAMYHWTFPQTLAKVAAALGLSDPGVKVLAVDRSEETTACGKVVSTGYHPVSFGKKVVKVFYVTIQQIDGKLVEFAGTQLERACQSAGVRKGDTIDVHMLGIELCESQEGRFKRRVFEVERVTGSILPNLQDDFRKQSTKEQLQRRIRELWEKGWPLDSYEEESLEVLKYFQARNIERLPEDFQKDLRAVREMAYYDDDGKVSKWLGLIGAVRDTDGTLRCVHRTYLKDGAKAPVSAPKRLMRLPEGETIAGCSIHLGEPGDVLCVAEGIETAASVVIGTGYPCWSCISANGLKSVRIPATVHTVFIFEDKDASMTGQKAAQALRARLQDEGRLAVICSISDPIPSGKKGLDWNDVLCMPDGESRFPVKVPRMINTEEIVFD